MKPCDRVDALLSDYLESEISPAETRFVEGHLTVCSRCRVQMEEVKVMLDRLTRLPRVQVSDDFTDGVLARTHGLVPAGLEEPVVRLLPVRRRPQWLAPLAAAAALAVIFFGVGQLSVFSPAGPGLARDSAPTAVADAVPDTRLDLEAAAGDRVQPEVASLSQLRPDLDAPGGQDAQALGMATDAYALDDWVLRGPTEGGTPVLTRVDADSGNRVMVTF